MTKQAPEEAEAEKLGESVYSRTDWKRLRDGENRP